MATSFFSNNLETTLSANITAGATTIPVTDASVFSTRIQDGAGTTDDLRQICTISDDLGNIEIVRVTNANTTTDQLTVVRGIESSVAYAFQTADNSKIDQRVTAEELNSCFLNRDYGVWFDNIGANAVDLVAARVGATHAAKGDSSFAVGIYAGTAAAHDFALGRTAYASGSYSYAIGAFTVASALQAFAAGHNAEASAQDTLALGTDSLARIAKTHNMMGPSLIRKDAGETDELMAFAGQETVLFSQEYNFTLTATDDVVTIEIPTGTTFFVSEVGIMPTVINTVTTRPTIEFGSNTTTDAILTATQTTTETVKKRERFESDATNWVADADNTGHVTQLTLSVTVAASATSYSGRVYFKGMLLEDE